ncbi:MAG: hypothetical protein HQL51_13495 [Magnetococcales bacterium]|nr:hypothetical protein [Magnetococcales bacterium]
MNGRDPWNTWIRWTGGLTAALAGLALSGCATVPDPAGVDAAVEEARCLAWNAQVETAMESRNRHDGRVVSQFNRFLDQHFFCIPIHPRELGESDWNLGPPPAGFQSRIDAPLDLQVIQDLRLLRGYLAAVEAARYGVARIEEHTGGSRSGDALRLSKRIRDVQESYCSAKEEISTPFYPVRRADFLVQYLRLANAAVPPGFRAPDDFGAAAGPASLASTPLSVDWRQGERLMDKLFEDILYYQSYKEMFWKIYQQGWGMGLNLDETQKRLEKEMQTQVCDRLPRLDKEAVCGPVNLLPSCVQAPPLPVLTPPADPPVVVAPPPVIEETPPPPVVKSATKQTVRKAAMKSKAPAALKAAAPKPKKWAAAKSPAAGKKGAVQRHPTPKPKAAVKSAPKPTPQSAAKPTPKPKPKGATVP